MKSFKQFVAEEAVHTEWTAGDLEEGVEQLDEAEYVHFKPRRAMSGMVGTSFKLATHADKVHASLKRSKHKDVIAKSYGGMGNHSFSITVKKKDAVADVVKHVERHFPHLKHAGKLYEEAEQLDEARYVHFTSTKHKGEDLADHAVDISDHLHKKWPLHYDLINRHGGSFEHNTVYFATRHADEAHSLRRHIEKHFPHMKHVATTTTPKLPKQK